MGLTTRPRKKQTVTRSEKATAGQTYLRQKGKRLRDLKTGSWNVPKPLTEIRGYCDHDIRILGERNWRNSVLNREECRELLKKARAHQGLSSQ
jgi:hypothetical protein